MSHRALIILAVLFLPLLATPAVGGDSIGTLFDPAEEAVWIIEAEGKKLGDHVFRYEGIVKLPGGTVAHRFTGRARLTIPGVEGLEQLYTAELLTDDEGRPIRHELRARIGDTVSRVEISVAGGKGTALVVQGPARKTIDLEVPDQSFILPNNFVGFLEILLRRRRPTQEEPVVATLLSPNIVRALPYRVTWKEDLPEENGVQGGVRVVDSLGEVMDLSPEGKVLRLEIPAQKIVMRRSDEKVESFTIGDPDVAVPPDPDLESEEVSIVHGEVSLAGEITRKKGSTGELPAVFFVSGSGAQDRHGYSMGVDTGSHEVLDRLTREGFLVLRVDDRGAGGSVGPTSEMGYDELVADARACVEFLAERPDVDPKRIALIGHSEGAVTVPLIAGERGDIAAVVLMAAPGRPMVDIIMDQNEMALDDLGIEGEEKAEKLSEVREALVRVSGEGPVDPESLPPDVRSLFAVRDWLQDHARVDVFGNVAKLRGSVLILQGGKDFQVSAEKDARLLERALIEAKHPDATVRIFPSLDHLFKKSPGERSRLADYFEKRPVDDEFLDFLSEWLVEKMGLETAKSERRTQNGEPRKEAEMIKRRFSWF